MRYKTETYLHIFPSKRPTILAVHMKTQKNHEKCKVSWGALKYVIFHSRSFMFHPKRHRTLSQHRTQYAKRHESSLTLLGGGRLGLSRFWRKIWQWPDSRHRV